MGAREYQSHKTSEKAVYYMTNGSKRRGYSLGIH